MATDRFALEQAIMNAWNTADDLETVAEAALQNELEPEELANALLGLQRLHHLRAKKAFDIFEALVESGDIK